MIIQPKLSPAWPEKNITHTMMFTGKSVYLFSAKFTDQTICRFMSLICFDWVGPIEGASGISAVLSSINTLWGDSRKEMNFVFVLQRNDKPNHRNFLINTCDYFEKRTQCRSIDRDNSLIIFTNNAGGPLPGKYPAFGYTSIISSEISLYDNNACPPTFAVNTRKLRGTDNLGRCKEALFRELGDCIHSFKFRHPSFVEGGPVGRCLPVEAAFVHASNAAIDDPRAQGGMVPASVKWINDELDDMSSMLYGYDNHKLKPDIDGTHNRLVSELRTKPDAYLRQVIEYASCKYNKWLYGKIHDVDNWDTSERSCIERVIHALSVINVCKEVTIGDSQSHAIIKIGQAIVDIFIISSTATHKDSFDYGMTLPKCEQRFTIVITRDNQDFSFDKKFGSILETDSKISDSGPDIMNPNRNIIHCGFQNLKQCCIDSANTGELDTKLNAIFSYE